MPVIRRPPGGGHGNPLQYSCLENPRDGGAWQAAIYGVTQTLTRLKWLSSSSSSSSRNTWFIFFLMSLMLNGRQLHTGSQISCLGFNWWIWRIWDVLRLYPIFFFFKSLFLFQRPVFCSQQNWAETTDTPHLHSPLNYEHLSTHMVHLLQLRNPHWHITITQSAVYNRFTLGVIHSMGFD